MWQDYVVTVVQAVFAVSLIPTIKDPAQKPALKTSMITGCGMIALAVVYGSKEWWWAASVAAIVSLQWCILAWQRHALDTKGNHCINWPLGKWIDQLFRP